MYKDKEKQKEATKDRVRRYRDKQKGVTLATKGVTSGMRVPPDIIDKLTDPFWRGRLERICQSFKVSHHPSYVNDVWLGNFNLSQVCELLDCTA